MTPATIKAIRNRAGLTQSGLARVLRISDIRTIRRWETGDVPITGPASVIMEMLEAGELPERFVQKQFATPVDAPPDCRHR